jgi:hypothetical protein
MSVPTRHLAAVPDDGPAVVPPVHLTRPAQLDLDQAELFLLSLDGELRADGPRTAYLLGVAEGHLANLIELVRGPADVR